MKTYFVRREWLRVRILLLILSIGHATGNSQFKIWNDILFEHVIVNYSSKTK